MPIAIKLLFTFTLSVIVLALSSLTFYENVFLRKLFNIISYINIAIILVLIYIAIILVLIYCVWVLI
jgi:hypothetical protein